MCLEATPKEIDELSLRLEKKIHIRVMASHFGERIKITKKKSEIVIIIPTNGQRELRNLEALINEFDKISTFKYVLIALIIHFLNLIYATNYCFLILIFKKAHVKIILYFFNWLEKITMQMLFGNLRNFKDVGIV